MGNRALVERAQAGDRAALAEIYEEYADRLYDLCFRVLRDRNAAADAVQDTFVLVAPRLPQLRDPERLRPWLYAVARHVSFRYLENLGRESVLYSVVVREVSVGDGATSDAPERAASLVEDAAGGMSTRDRLVLELHERHGLDGEDLMAALGARQASPDSFVERAREQFELAVGVLLVARLGRGDCPELDELLRDWDGELTPLLRKRIGRHVDRCDKCTTVRSQTNPLALLTAVPMLVRPARADAAVLEGDTLISARFGMSDEPWPDDGFPPPLPSDETHRRRPVLVWLAGVALIVLGVVTVVSVAAGGDGSSTVEAVAPSTSAPTVPPTSTPRPTVPDATTVAPPPTEVVTTIAGITESVPTTPTTRRRGTTPTTRRGTPTTGASAPTATPTAAPGTTAPRATTPHATTPAGPTGTTAPPSVTTSPTTDPPVTDPPVTDPPVTDPPVTDPPTTDPPPTDPPLDG